MSYAVADTEDEDDERNETNATLYNDDDDETEEGEEGEEEENGTRAKGAGGKEEKIVTRAVDYMETMKRELAAKHRQIKIVQKIQHKRQMMKWRNSARDKAVHLFAGTVSSSSSPERDSVIPETASFANKRQGKAQILRRKQELINAKNSVLSLNQ